MKRILPYILIAISFAVFSFADAAIKVTGAEYSVKKEDKITENLYVTSSSINFLGSSTKDVFLIGRDVYVDGNIDGDLFVVAKNAVVNGTVGGDVRIASATYTSRAKIKGDLVVLAGENFLSEELSVESDSMFFGGTVDTKGATFTGETNIVSGRAIIEGEFNENVTVSAQDVTLGEIKVGDQTEIDYYSPKTAIEKSPNEGVNIQYNKTGTWKDNGIIKHSFLVFVSFWTVLRFVTTMIIIFFFTYGFRNFTRSMSVRATDHPWKSMLFGFVVVVGIPIAVLLLLISLVGLPIGVLLALVYIMLFVVRYAVMSIVLGAFIKRNAGWDASDGIINFWYSILGLIILTILQFIPYIHAIASIVLTLIAFGAVAAVITKPLKIKRR